MATKTPIKMNVQVSLETEGVKMNDERIRRFPATQTWGWDRGDAIVVLTGGYNTKMTTYVVLRLGSKVAIYEGRGLMHALEQAGENPNDYEIVAPY